jgi:hypothetical protein
MMRKEFCVLQFFGNNQITPVLTDARQGFMGR